MGNGVGLYEPGALGAALDALGTAGAKVLADPDSGPAWVFSRLREAGAEVVAGADPCQLPKARKNAVELDGTRAAHRRDGLTLTRFLCWLDREAPARAPGAELGEVEVADRLRALRAEDDLFRDVSFDTIAGAGANGAIVHYRAEEATQGRLRKGELLLLDSGGQYPDGTTDVTRTVAIGEPSAEMRARFTRVLKGHISLATVRFPRGTSGSQLDVLARQHLWQAGLDYDHGTGHGVGSYLNVHEGPQRISKVPNRVALEPGMIVSNEPGYYKTGAYGIRIENLVAVVESDVMEESRGGDDGEDRSMLAFETLTLAPIDRNLIDVALLSADETAWLDAYHARVRSEFIDKLDPETAQWLEAATQPLGG
jgi:Xaa-Pro aminopeptidase